MTKLFKSFAKDQDGAVTVDWVVLTAAIVGIAIAVLAVIQSGLDTTATQISTALTDAVSTALN